MSVSVRKIKVLRTPHGLPEHFSVLVEAADLRQDRVLDPSGVREDGGQRRLRALVPHNVVDGLDDAPVV